MDSKFSSLKPMKKERIMNAAMREFARSGYERASTNEIIKEAGIAKGSLFVYFKNKKELYLFLCDYMTEIINKIYDEIDLNETDIFKRFKEIAFIKLKIYHQYPQVFDFLKAVTQEKSPEVKDELDQRLKTSIFEHSFERIYRNIDLTKFRNDIDRQKAINIINWTALSFAEQQSNILPSYEDFTKEHFKEWDGYLDLLKHCFYKKEEI